jgi:hypothetical protein
MPRREFLVRAGEATVAILGTGTLLESCTAPTGYTIGFMVVVQSIQDLHNSIPLVAGKRFMIRVFPVSNLGAADTPNITGTLAYTDDPHHTFSPRNGSVSSHPRSAISLDATDQSLDFELPLQLGRLEVQCRLSDGHGSTASATQAFQFHFLSGGEFATETLRPVLIHSTAYGAPAPTMADYSALLDGAKKRLPVPLTRYVLNPPWFWVNHDAMTTADDFLGICADMAWSTFGQPNIGMPTGAISPPPDWPGGTDGMYWEGPGIQSVLSFTTGNTVDLDTAETTFAHEFTHRYIGLRHAGGCGAPNVDPTLPLNTDMTGLDVGQNRLIPRGTPELMTYCGNLRWPSSTTYRRILSSLS